MGAVTAWLRTVERTAIFSRSPTTSQRIFPPYALSELAGREGARCAENFSTWSFRLARDTFASKRKVARIDSTLLSGKHPSSLFWSRQDVREFGLF